MKTSISLCMFQLTFWYILNAQTPQIALVKPNGTTSIYTIFDSAYVHAADGDFIYLPGGYFTVDNPINKSIHIFGAGFNQDSSEATGITTLDRLVIYNGAANGSIEGLKINYGNGCAYGSMRFGDEDNSDPISGYTISNCYLVGGINLFSVGSNITLKNNLIGNHSCGSGAGSSISGNIENSLLTNNIFFRDINVGGTPNLLVSNNLFFFWDQFNSGSLPHYSTYENNIFQTGENYYTSFSTFNNNTNASISGTDNVFNQQVTEIWDLIFESTGTPGSYGQYSYDVVNDYHVKSTSDCHNSGTDGTDRGVYGGLFPWTDGSIPSNPHIYFKDIYQLTGPDGKLHIEVGVRTNN